MADRSLQVQKAIVARLKAASAVTSIVGQRIYDRAPQNVTFPYLRLMDVSSVPFDAEALRGRDMLLQISVFSRAVGRVEARQVMAAINEALHRRDLELEAGVVVLCRVSSARDMADPDDVTTHGIVELQIITDG